MNTEIGVIRRQESVAQGAPPTIAAAEEFAAGVTLRYAPRAMMASQADIALAWEAPAEINYYQDARAGAAPSLTIQNSIVFPDVHRESSAASAAPRFGEKDAEQLFERLFSRHARVASFPSHALPERPSAAAPGMPSGRWGDSRASGTQPVDRALPLSPAARIAPASRDKKTSAQPELSERGWGTPSVPPAESKPVVLAPPEVRRVAEQVMREINHRVLAQRERLGRR